MKGSETIRHDAKDSTLHISWILGSKAACFRLPTGDPSKPWIQTDTHIEISWDKSEWFANQIVRCWNLETKRHTILHWTLEIIFQNIIKQKKQKYIRIYICILIHPEFTFRIPLLHRRGFELLLVFISIQILGIWN